MTGEARAGVVAEVAHGAVVCESCHLRPVTVLVFVEGEGFRTCTECAADGVTPRVMPARHDGIAADAAARVQTSDTAEPGAVAAGTASAPSTGATTTRGVLC